MAPLRDTMSLRPQGFYGYAFVFARTLEIMALVAILGLLGNFIFMLTTSKQNPAASLVVALIITSFAILWTSLSWNGYSKRYLPYRATWIVDILFLIPFATFTVLLGLPLSTATCSELGNNSFTLDVPAGGRLNFTGQGQAACVRLFGVWGLLMGVCALFGISALSAGFLQLGERRLALEVQNAREGAGGGGYYPQQAPGQMELGDFQGPKSQKSWDSVSSSDGGARNDPYPSIIVNNVSRKLSTRGPSPSPYYRSESAMSNERTAPGPTSRYDGIKRAGLPSSVKMPPGSRSLDPRDDDYDDDAELAWPRQMARTERRYPKDYDDDGKQRQKGSKSANGSPEIGLGLGGVLRTSPPPLSPTTPATAVRATRPSGQRILTIKTGGLLGSSLKNESSTRSSRWRRKRNVHNGGGEESAISPAGTIPIALSLSTLPPSSNKTTKTPDTEPKRRGAAAEDNDIYTLPSTTYSIKTTPETNNTPIKKSLPIPKTLTGMADAYLDRYNGSKTKPRDRARTRTGGDDDNRQTSFENIPVSPLSPLLGDMRQQQETNSKKTAKPLLPTTTYDAKAASIKKPVFGGSSGGGGYLLRSIRDSILPQPQQAEVVDLEAAAPGASGSSSKRNRGGGGGNRITRMLSRRETAAKTEDDEDGDGGGGGWWDLFLPSAMDSTVKPPPVPPKRTEEEIAAAAVGKWRRPGRSVDGPEYDPRNMI
ncbi:hypothetical protein B0H66DRAFT_586362 [Apodospora peruviana]|uniref:Uncharacterized protein n=1 Tax=Apodospora peruviana TaxID=516989 RepID=A0AAE0ISU2_9PEZI|nr:hypothetical protein B0H66DRAFT_586362 [Apodospora peruviana]